MALLVFIVHSHHLSSSISVLIVDSWPASMAMYDDPKYFTSFFYVCLSVRMAPL